MLPGSLVSGGLGVSAALSAALLRCSGNLSLAASNFASRVELFRSRAPFHARAQEIVSSCRIPSPQVPEVYGNVNLREGLTAVDGPGLRYLVVLPSSDASGESMEGSPVSSKAIANELCHLRPYLLDQNGGVSIASNGSTQHGFCMSIFKEAHALNLSTCLQTTAHGTASIALEEVLAHTDMVGLDVRPKHSPSDVFSGDKDWGVDEIAHFAEYLHEHRIPYFLRYVLVPGITDDQYDINMLMNVAQILKPSLQGVQLLPYHLLGGTRWQGMGYGQVLKGRIQPFKIEMLDQLVKQMSNLGLPVSASLKTA